MVANERWAQMLSEWAIPQDLIAAVPESPYFFDPVVFTGAADEAVQRSDDTPSDRAAREALSVGGQVLDVGVGAGAASLRLGAGSVVGVDPSERCSTRSPSTLSVSGWPAPRSKALGPTWRRRPP